LNDPFDMDEAWQMRGLLQLCYNDHDLDVQTLKRLNPAPNGAELGTFGYVFDYSDGRLVRIKPKITSSP
jgi:hypothetical protein